MPVETERVRVLIATTSGPVEVLLLTEEDEAIGRSVACVGGTTETANIDAGYHAFVARPTGVVARLFGHSCYRIDLSARIDAGSSWQLGVLAAHALHACGRLARENDVAVRILWATGAVRAVDLTVGAVTHVSQKIDQSLERLRSEANAGRRVLLALPSANSQSLSPDVRADLTGLGVEILEIAHVGPLWEALQLMSTESALATTAGLAGPAASTQETWSWPWRLGVAGFALCVAAAIAGGLAFDWPLAWRAERPNDLRSELSAALGKSIPKASVAYQSRAVEDFAKVKTNRALAVAIRSQKSFRTSGWASRDLAEEKALERCQQYHDEPCAILASNDVVANTGPLPLRDAPRVRYSGAFNPERIPGVDKTVEGRADVVGYLTAPGPKAAAYQASGLLHIATGSSSQHEAEEKALRDCNDNPLRSSSARGPCYLYAVDTRVVLPLRSTVPLTPPQASLPQLHDLLLSMLTRLAPTYSGAYRQVREYLEAKQHKALAVLPPSHSWRTSGRGTAQEAEESVLEGCEMRFADACILLAVDDAIRLAGPRENWRPRSMARSKYEGMFDPQQIPAVADETKRRDDVVGYRSAENYKAAAIHPWGRIFLAVRKGSLREAEESALAACNGDSDRAGKDGPCLIYAAGDQVVLPKRLFKPE